MLLPGAVVAEVRGVRRVAHEIDDQRCRDVGDEKQGEKYLRATVADGRVDG